METSHDGSRMVTAGDGLYLWRLDAKEPELLAELSTANYEKSHIGLSPNGQWLVVREHGGAVKAWDLTATPPTSRSAGHMPGYKVSGRIFITNDGRWVALSVEVEVDEQKSRYARQLWDLHHADPKANALTLYEELPDSEWVRLLAISSDGRWLATHMGKVFDLAAENPHRSFLELAPMGVAAFSPDSKELFSGYSGVPGMRRWNLEEVANDPDYRPEIFETKHGPVDISISKDGKRLAATTSFGDAYRWDLNGEARTPAAVSLSHGNATASVAVSPDGRWVGVGGSTPRLWDMNTADPELSSLVIRRSSGVELATLTAVSHDGRWIATTTAASQPTSSPANKDAAHGDIDVEIWDNYAKVDPGSYRRQLTGFGSPISALTISSDGQWLVATSRSGESKAWNLKQDDPSASVTTFGEPAREERLPELRPGATISGSRLFTVGAGGDVFQWDLNTAHADSTRYAARYADLQVYGLAVSPDGQQLATASLKGVRVWDLEQPADAEPVKLVEKANTRYTLLAFSANGRWLAEGTFGNVRVWDLEAADNELQVRNLTDPDGGPKQGIWQMAMSPDAKWLYVTRYSGEARLWDLTGQRPVPRDLSGQVQSAAISSDSRWLVTTHRHGNVQLWDLFAEDIESSLIVLSGHDGPVWKAEFSGDSSWLVTFGGDGTIRRWMLDVNQLMEYGSRIAGRTLEGQEGTKTEPEVLRIP